MSIGTTISRGASHAAEAAKGVAGYATHTASRIGQTNAFQSIANSAPGQFIGRHKMAAGVVAAGTVAAVVYNAGGNHRERLLQTRAAQEQGQQR